MDRRQARSVERYRAIARDPRATAASAASRPASELGKGAAIWRDIRAKLGVRRGERLLDLGCGFGEVTHQCLRDSRRLNLKLVLFDIDEVIDRLKREFGDRLPRSARCHAGVFPAQVPATFRKERKFDCILAYSVLHYTDRPRAFIAAACRLLAPGGRLLVGDLPNVNRKGRFLASDSGRAFEARYRGVPPSRLPRYADHKDYARRSSGQNPRINDALVCGVLRECRRLGLDVFVLPQPAGLPFSQTREDLLICRR